MEIMIRKIAKVLNNVYIEEEIDNGKSSAMPSFLKFRGHGPEESINKLDITKTSRLSGIKLA